MQVIKQFETQFLTWKPKREKPQIVLLLIYFKIIGQHQLTRMHPHPISPTPTSRRQQPPCLCQHQLTGKTPLPLQAPTCLSYLWYSSLSLCNWSLHLCFAFSSLVFCLWSGIVTLFYIQLRSHTETAVTLTIGMMPFWILSFEHLGCCFGFFFTLSLSSSYAATPTLTLSNVSLQHYCTSNSLHVKLHWTPLLLLIFIYCSMSHTSFASILNHYIGLPWHEPSCPSKQHTSSLDTSSCKDASFWKDTSIVN